MKKQYIFELYWSPEGRLINKVRASTAREALKTAPHPYKKYLGEIYVKQIGEAAQ